MDLCDSKADIEETVIREATKTLKLSFCGDFPLTWTGKNVIITVSVLM